MLAEKNAESSDSQSWDIIKESHALSGKPEELDQYYQKWAKTYDDDVSNKECNVRSVMKMRQESFLLLKIRIWDRYLSLILKFSKSKKHPQMQK